MAQQKRRRNRSRTKEVYLKRGDMYNRRREHTKAKAAFLQVLDIDADDADAHHNLGITYMALEAPETAASHFEKALALNPKMSSVYYKLAYVYVELERFEEAVEMGTAALTADRDEEKEKAHYALGRAYIDLDVYDKALYHFQQARALGLESIELDLYIGNTYAFLGKFDLAFKHLQKSLTRNPGIPMVHTSIALVYMRQGKLEEAEKYLADALFLDPNCESTHKVLELFEKDRKAQKQEENT